MIAKEAWDGLDGLARKAVIHRWTASRPGQVTFQLERRGDYYQVVVETGREPRKFDQTTFEEFWRHWSLGKRVPDDFRNIGPTGGMFKLAYYLLPIAAALDATTLERRFKYGDKPTWKFVVEAVRDLGGRASFEQIRQHISIRAPQFNLSDVGSDLNLVTVNAFGRSNWSQNEKPRRVDGSNMYDILFDEGGAGASYVFFDPEIHGVWELVAVPDDAKLRPHRLDAERTEEELSSAHNDLNDNNWFDPDDDTDARRKTLGAIARRRGQLRFRRALLKAYSGRCAFSGCDVEQALEAAHIRPYLGDHTNVVVNGLLLRADLHTLFDLHLIRVNPDTMKIEASPKLKGPYYQRIAGATIALPRVTAEWPSREILRWHWIACQPNFAAAAATIE